MAGNLPKRDKKKVTPCPYYIRNSPYYKSRMENDSPRARGVTNKCGFKSSRLEEDSKRLTTLDILNQRQQNISCSEKVEKRVAGESRMKYCLSPSRKKALDDTKHCGNNLRNHGSPIYETPEELQWDTSVENFSSNNSNDRKVQEKLEQRFHNVTKKMQSPCIRKIKTEVCYDQSCLSKTTRKVLDNRNSTNEMLWVNPKYLDKRMNLVKILSESEDKPSRVEVPIATYIRGQKQLKMKRNRRHGERYYFDSELGYRRIMHDKSHSLNLHTHVSGYDDDMGDPERMQKEMTAEEKKVLGSYPEPPYPELGINPEDLFPLRVIASESSAGRTGIEKDKSSDFETTKINTSRSDDLLCQLGIYSGSELSEQPTPRESLDGYSPEKIESDPSIDNYTNNEESESARSNDISPPIEDITDPITYILNKEYSSSRTTMEDYLEFRNIMALSRESGDKEIIEEVSSLSNSTASDTENVTSAEETEDCKHETITTNEPKENICHPSVFFPDMIPDPNFKLIQSEKSEIELDVNSNNNNAPEIKLEQVKVESNAFLEYQCPNTEEFYEELEKWFTLVRGNNFRRHLRGPGLTKYRTFAPSQKKTDSGHPIPKPDVKIFEELYKKYILDKNNLEKEPEETEITGEIVSKTLSDNILSCPSMIFQSQENVCVNCIYKSPANPSNFPLQVIAEEKSECEVDFGQPVITKNWLYNFLLKPSAVEVESVITDEEYHENEYQTSPLKENEFQTSIHNEYEYQSSILEENEYQTSFLNENDFEDSESIRIPVPVTTSPQSSNNNEVEVDERTFWLEPAIDWDNLPPFMVYNIMKMTGGFLTDVYSKENCTSHQNKADQEFTSVFSPANINTQRSAVVSIEEVNSTEEDCSATPSSSAVTVIEKQIPIQQKLPQDENIQIPSTSAKENIPENAEEEKERKIANIHRLISSLDSETDRRKLPTRIALGIYSKLRNMRASLSRMMTGMKNYFRAKGVVRRISPSSLSPASKRNRNRISVIKGAPVTFQTFSTIKLCHDNANPGVKTHSSL